MPEKHSLGLQFRKLDLHLHTPGSTDHQEPQVDAAAIVSRALAQGLDGIAVTDHNSGAWIDAIKTAAAETALVVFPGVEITCAGGYEGIHIIALFDPSCGGTHIDNLLSALGFRPESYGDIKAITDKNPKEVVEIIQARNGLAILAHANSSKGALHDMRGQQRIQLVQCRSVAAVEATDCNSEDLKSQHKRTIDILDGSDPNYHTAHAVIQGSDAHSLEVIGSRCSYFKLDRISLDGLRQCFSDPTVRIRQDFEYQIIAFPRIQRVHVTGGFLDDATADFHEGLNSILGAKGAGKSLLVEFLRFALDQAPQQEDIQYDHTAKLRSRLEDYSSVEVNVVDETGRPLTFKRTYNPAEGNPYEDGERDDVAQLFPVLFLSQNEIIRIAEDPDQQIAFIDRFFDFRAYQAAIQDLEGQLRAVDRDLAESFRAKKEVNLLDAQVRQKEADVLKLDQALKNPLFDQYAQLELKDRAFRDQLKWIDDTASRVRHQRAELEGAAPADPPAQVAADPAIRRVVALVEQARTVLPGRLDAALLAFDELRSKADAEHKRWLPEFQTVKTKYEETIRLEGGDNRALAQQRTKLTKELENLRSRRSQRHQVAERGRVAGERRKSLMGEITKAYQNYSGERRSRCEKIQSDSAGRLRIVLREASGADEFKRRLRELKKGSYLRDAEVDTICAQVAAADFMRGVVNYALSANTAHIDSVAKKAGLDPARMKALAEFLANTYDYETLLALEYTAMPEDKPEIRYDVGSGRFELLENLSVGQKCTAMLIMALTEGTRPIVIDQPEDSLDLRSIWEDICSKVRSGKEHRQFVFTTHNSSVAVASDTDKFIIMEAEADRGRVVFSGSMDHQPISGEAMRYLEGGTHTYRTKYRKYRGDHIV